MELQPGQLSLDQLQSIHAAPLRLSLDSSARHAIRRFADKVGDAYRANAGS